MSSLESGALLIRRKTAALALCAAVALTVGFVAPARSADPVEINVITPLTGGGAFLGSTQMKALQQLETIENGHGGIKGRPIHFNFLDDQTNPQVTVQLANQLIAKKVPIVLGSSLSGMCRAILPLFATNGPVNYCLSPAIYPPKGSYGFTASVSTRDLLYATVRFFREKGWTKIAMLSTTDASGQDGDHDLADALTFPENKGMTVLDTEHYNPGDVSATAQVAKIKATNPQALIIWAPGTAFGTGLHAVSEIGLDVPVASTSANMVNAQLKGYAAFAPKYLVFPGLGFAINMAQTPKVAAAQKVYTDALNAAGLDNSVQRGLTWDAALITIDALRAVGPDASPEAIKTYIEGIKDFAGITGVYNFSAGSSADQRGLDINDVVMMRWDSTKSSWTAVSRFGAAL
jgi:branched-chain amino acid transport system substrate-binding protein